MKCWQWLVLCTALSAGAEEVKSPVTGVMIFKNGISAVRRSIEPGKALAFDLACDIQPVLGSLWFTGPVSSVVRQEVAKPEAGTYPLENITKSFAGKQVTLLVTSQTPDKAVREISGIVWDPEPKPKKGQPENVFHNPQVWLKLADGSFEMIASHLICGVRCAEEPKKAALPEQFDKRPVWHFTLAKKAEKPILVDYLTEGLQWQSAYRIELGKEQKMTITQDVEIVNNLADLENVSLYLASGFANFLNQGNISPMAMVQPDDSKPLPRLEFAGGMTNQTTAVYAAAPRFKGARANMAMADGIQAEVLGEAATGESEDISLLPLKNLSLKKGEVCHRETGHAETAYERLVHWSIRPRRDAAYGRNTGADAEVPMDALRFTNPFEVPITTSPVEVRDGGVVLAQVKIPWVNPKQTTTLDITKALSITGTVLEYEVPAESTSSAEQVFQTLDRNDKNKIVSGWVAGMRYRITDVKGKIKLKNYRKLPARILIDLDYSGTFVSADADPKQEQQGRTLSINPSSRLSWDLTLQPGEEKVLNYRYNIFVNY